MKKIITLLFFAGLAFSAVAQRGPRPQYRDGAMGYHNQYEQHGREYNSFNGNNHLNNNRRDDGYGNPSFERGGGFDRYRRFERFHYERRHLRMRRHYIW